MNDAGGLPWSQEREIATVIDTLDPSSFLRHYCTWAQRQSDAPAMFASACGLALLSSVFPAELRSPKQIPGPRLHGNLYVMLVGRQAMDRKTTAIKFAVDLLNEACPARRGDDPGSGQGLIKSLSERPQQLLRYEDMGDLFMKTAASSSGNPLEAIKGKLLTLFDCQPQENRLRRSVERVERPRLSILGGINRALLDEYSAATDWTGGLMSRFLVAYAHRERRMTRKFPDDRARAVLVHFLKRATTISPKLWGHCVGLTPAAWRMVDALEYAVGTTAVRGDAARLAGPKGRILTHATKVAMLLAWGEGLGWPEGDSVGLDWKIKETHMQAAIEIALASYCGALAISHTSRLSPYMKERERVLSVVASAPTTHGEQATFAAILKGAELSQRSAASVVQSLITEGTIVASGQNMVDARYWLPGTYVYQMRGVSEALEGRGALFDTYSDALVDGVPPSDNGITVFDAPAMPWWAPSEDSLPEASGSASGPSNGAGHIEPDGGEPVGAPTTPPGNPWALDSASFDLPPLA